MNKPIQPRARIGARLRARGFTIIEMLAALALAAMMVVGVTALVNSSLADTQAQQAALYQSQMTTAATQLVQQNYAALVAQATTATPVVVALNGGAYQLSSYLPNAMSGKNPYGQTPCLLVYAAPTPGALQALLVTEGGSTITDPELGYIAANAGAGGGAIQATNNAGGAATGAYGGWSVSTPNPANASCSGAKTGKGHLASLVYYDATQTQNTDYLYRVGVPGNPGANTMQVPIVLATQPAAQSDYTACASSGAIAADATGNVLTCMGGIWEPQASYHWRGAVANAAALSGLPSPSTGDVAMTLAKNRAYTYTAGGTWQALAVDEQGNLALGNTATVGNACAASEANTTPVSTDLTGRVLSCQGGTWQTQSEIETNSSQTACYVLMEGWGGGVDFPGCTIYPLGTNYNAAPFWYSASDTTYYYQNKTSITLAKPGMIAVSAWAHMNTGSATPGSGATPGGLGQMIQTVQITDSSGTVLASTNNQSPVLDQNGQGITNNLTQAEPAGIYTITVLFGWATYNYGGPGISTPWVSSYQGGGGATIYNSPLATGWTISSFY